MIIALCSSDFYWKSDRIIAKYLLCRMSKQIFKELFKVVRLQSVWKVFPPRFKVHCHLDVLYVFKYRPYSHVHAGLHSTAHPQRKLPIIFCITPHASPTYSPLAFCWTLFHLTETGTFLLSTVWIIAIDKWTENKYSNGLHKNICFDWQLKVFPLSARFHVSSNGFPSPAFETWKWHSPNCQFSKNILNVEYSSAALILLITERSWNSDFLLSFTVCIAGPAERSTEVL